MTFLYSKDDELIDSQHIGLALNKIRTSKGLSQAVCASWFGFSSQQWQKFEKGVNRISFARIRFFLHKTKTSLQEFESLLGMKYNEPQELIECYNENSSDRENLSLIKAFSSIKNEEIRKNIIKLVKSFNNKDK